MKFASWLNTARIMGILYALFVFSLAYLVYIETRITMDNWDLFINGAKMALWQLVQCALVGLMIESWRQYSTSATISRHMARFMFWAPRIVWVLIILFLALIGLLLFLDGFSQTDDIWTHLQVFALFLAPSIIVGIILAAAWFWEWVGAGVISLAAFFLLSQLSYSSFFLMLQGIIVIIVPMLLFAAAFWMNWRWRKEIRAAI